MFNTKLEEKSYKMSFKALPVKTQQSKNHRGVNTPPFPFPPGLIGFLVCKSNSSANCREKYLSQKVISKESLKILEVNIHV